MTRRNYLKQSKAKKLLDKQYRDKRRVLAYVEPKVKAKVLASAKKCRQSMSEQINEALKWAYNI